MLGARPTVPQQPSATRDPRPATLRRHGGRRPGAGAPQGNLNALKTGRYSRRVKALRAALSAMPLTTDLLAQMTGRERRKLQMLAYGLQSYAELLRLIASGQSIDDLADPQLRRRVLYAIPIKQSARPGRARRGGPACPPDAGAPDAS
jgi:hypothetical protein